MINMMLYDFRQKGSGRQLTLENDKLSRSPRSHSTRDPESGSRGCGFHLCVICLIIHRPFKAIAWSFICGLAMEAS